VIDGLRTYPKYIESGHDALGQVPVHWEVTPLGRLGRFLRGGGGSKEDEVPDGVPCVRYGDLYTTHEFWITQTRSFIPPDRVADYTCAQLGDVLFATSGETLDEIGKSAVNLIEGEVRVGGDVVILRPTQPIDLRFLGYACDAAASVAQKARMGKGITVMHIYPQALRNLVLALPPSDEQTAIVRYLDHVDSRIERFLEAKERLIELLEEERQAIIHRTVTSGLDSSVPFKRSGVDWIGDIPESWGLTRAKWALREVDERSVTGEEELLSVSHLTGVTPRAQKDVTMFEPESYVGHKLCRPGDLVVNTMWAWMGALGASDRVGIVSPSYAVYRPIGDGFRPTYVERLLRTRVYVDEFMRRSTGIRPSRRRLYPPQFLTVPLLHPPLEEQDRILDAIATHPTGPALRRAQRQIELAREYRTRLISDVVTGKLDAREAAAKLPPEADRQDRALDGASEAAAAA
jgi:type I restriction enzyme S subunit